MLNYGLDVQHLLSEHRGVAEHSTGKQMLYRFDDLSNP